MKKVFTQLEGQAWQILGSKTDTDIDMKMNQALRAKQNTIALYKQPS